MAHRRGKDRLTILTSAAQKIARLTTTALKKKDSLFNPKWEDFLEICDHVADWQI
ncbi:MAG: hypothetical protein WEB60_04330 [Terrimicrobiaceae bacterium]